MDDQNKINSKVIETYAEDMADVIGSDTEGLVKKIIHGAEEEEKEKLALSPDSKQNKFFLIGSIILTILALGLVAFLFLTSKPKTVPVEQQFTPLIFNDKTVFPEISGLKPEEIKQTVVSEINSAEIKDNAVEGIYLTENKKLIGFRKFLSLTGMSFVPGDNPLFISDNFLMGAVNKGFFLLLKTRSTQDIFDPMRAWEDKMFAELHSFLGVNIDSSNSYLLTKNFEDGIIENKNARILRDNNGNIILMYVFGNDSSVVITGSSDAAHEVILRLTTAKVTQ